jgi:uncharacterized protein YhaN
MRNTIEEYDDLDQATAAMLDAFRKMSAASSAVLTAAQNKLSKLSAELTGTSSELTKLSASSDDVLEKAYDDALADLQKATAYLQDVRQDWQDAARRDLADIGRRLDVLERQKFVQQFNAFIATKGGRADWSPGCGEPKDATLQNYQRGMIH